MTRLTCIALTLAVLTCASPPKAEPGDNQHLAPAGSGKQRNGGVMSTPFQEALRRFQSEVASTYGKRVDDLKILPPSDDVVGFDDQKTGDLIPFEATAPELRVRGFASKSAVVLLKHNQLGPLFRAAHALDAGASLSARDLAARLVWMMGPEHRLVDRVIDYPKRPLPAQIAPPTLDRGVKGAVLRFYYVELDIHGGPATGWSAEVQCLPDYKAALVTAPGP